MIAACKRVVRRILDKFNYRDPLRKAVGVIPLRTDQGVDFMAKKGSPIVAMGDGVITRATRNAGWPGGGCVQYKLTGRGSHKGEEIYVAEFIVPVVRVGQWVKKNQIIAYFTRGSESGVGIETGWVRRGTNEPCSTDTSGVPTPGGKNFTRWLNQLGRKTLQHFGPGATHCPC